jgi:hypothetical protein
VAYSLDNFRKHSTYWSFTICDVLYVHVTMHRNNFFVIKPTRCTNFTNLFWHKTTCFGQFLYPSSGVYSLVTQQLYVIQVCRQLSSRTKMVLLESCLQTCMTYTIAECTVNKLLMVDRGRVRNM